MPRDLLKNQKIARQDRSYSYVVQLLARQRQAFRAGPDPQVAHAHAGNGQEHRPVVIKHVKHQSGTQQHAEGGADFGFALDDFTVAPIEQNRAKQTVVFEPGTQARGALGRSPGSEQNKFGGG